MNKSDSAVSSEKNLLSVIDGKIKTPLGSINWNLELLLNRINEYKLPVEAVELIKKSHRINTEIIDSVEDLVYLSKINQNKIRSHIKGFSLIDIIKEIIDELSHEAMLKNVKLKLRINKGHKYFVKMDRDQIKKAIENVIENAVKYSFQESEVSISLNRKDKSFEIKVSNVGVGISAKDNKCIFSKFFRAKKTIKMDSKGLGLGLFITKSFVERIDGNVSFSSNKDKRTVFIIRIPTSISH